jgi:phosphonate transport system substrate-binding protein
MLSRRLLLSQLGLLLAFGFSSCEQTSSSGPIERWIIGLVSYDASAQSVDQYDRFKAYLEQTTHKIIELEPALNELQAIQQISSQAWAIVFAPPGLAAIAISKYQYTPLLALQGISNLRSVLVVRDDSPIQNIGELANKTVALGQVGSATGYYLPLYDLYGLTLAEIRFAPTPVDILDWLSQGTADAGALSEEEFRQHRSQFGETKFRVLHTSRRIPVGSVLVSPTVSLQNQEFLKTVMSQADSSIAEDAGYISNAPVPDYSQFIQLVEKVRPLEAHVKQKPAVLEFIEEES